MRAGGWQILKMHFVVREGRISRLPVRHACSPYTATGTLWKVEMTVSNVWTLGVPSITFAKVFNTSG